MKIVHWVIAVLATIAVCVGVVYYVRQPAVDLGPIIVPVHKDSHDDLATTTSVIGPTGTQNPPPITESQVYHNPGLGPNFVVPTGWVVNELIVDPVTHADIWKDGKMYSSLSITITSESNAISITDANYDLVNKGLPNQISAFACPQNTKDNICQRTTTSNGTVYYKYYSCAYSELGYPPCNLDIDVPTGKMVVDFSPSLPVADTISELITPDAKNKPMLNIMDSILGSLKFQ